MSWQQSLTCPKVEEVETSSLEETRSHSRASLKTCGIEEKRTNRNEAPRLFVCLLTVEHFCLMALGAFCDHLALGKKTLGKTPQFLRHGIKSRESTKAFVSLWLE